MTGRGQVWVSLYWASLWSSPAYFPFFPKGSGMLGLGNGRQPGTAGTQLAKALSVGLLMNVGEAPGRGRTVIKVSVQRCAVCGATITVSQLWGLNSRTGFPHSSGGWGSRAGMVWVGFFCSLSAWLTEAPLPLPAFCVYPGPALLSLQGHGAVGLGPALKTSFKLDCPLDNPSCILRDCTPEFRRQHWIWGTWLGPNSMVSITEGFLSEDDLGLR